MGCGHTRLTHTHAHTPCTRCFTFSMISHSAVLVPATTASSPATTSGSTAVTPSTTSHSIAPSPAMISCIPAMARFFCRRLIFIWAGIRLLAFSPTSSTSRTTGTQFKDHTVTITWICTCMWFQVKGVANSTCSTSRPNMCLFYSDSTAHVHHYRYCACAIHNLCRNYKTILLHQMEISCLTKRLDQRHLSCLLGQDPQAVTKDELHTINTV